MIENIKIDSKSLNKKMNASVYIPDKYKFEKLPVLYFLHGRNGNEKILEQLKLDKNMDKLINDKKIKPFIIVCPNIDNSRVINSSAEYKEVKGKYGKVFKGLYEDYFINEVIQHIDEKFNTLKTRENRFIGGISSGGYAALHNGFRHNELFSKIGGHMPAIDLSFDDEDECYFEDEKMWLKYDPITIAKNKDFNNIKVYLDDGNQDEGKFYLACEKLSNILKEKNISVQNHVFEGKHDGEYVFKNIEKYLLFYGN